MAFNSSLSLINGALTQKGSCLVSSFSFSFLSIPWRIPFTSAGPPDHRTPLEKEGSNHGKGICCCCCLLEKKERKKRVFVFFSLF